MNIGYACQIAGHPGYTLNTCRLAAAKPDRLADIARGNLETLRAMLAYNQSRQIRLFRISSDLIPFGSHPAVDFPWREQFAETLHALGQSVLDCGMRVSMHPGQYTLINSPDPDVVQRAILDLRYHADVLNLMGLPAAHKLVLHIGGAYGDKERALGRFIEQAKRLPEHVLQRLTLENDDRLFGIESVLRACDALSLPAVFDELHFQCNPSEGSGKAFMRLCGNTWRTEDGVQKIHYAQQRPGGKAGAHALTIDIDQWLEDSADFEGLDVMLEVKDKNLSQIKCAMITNGATRTELEREWGRYKYLVMRHSQAHYEALRKIFRDPVEPVAFFRLVDAALQVAPTQASVTNAAQHIWGYFKDKELPKAFLSHLARYQNGQISETALFSCLYRMAQKHKETYLLDSLSF